MTDLIAPRYTPWNDRLAFDVALLLENSGETMKEVLERHKLDANDMAKFSQDPVFQEKISNYRANIREKGMTFQLKARAQAEELLTTSWLLIHDRDVSPAVKADLIKATVKWAGLEPTDTKTQSGGGSGVSITINLGGEPVPMKIIEHEGVEE